MNNLLSEIEKKEKRRLYNKELQKVYYPIYYQENRDKLLEQDRLFYKAKREERLEYFKERYKVDKPARLARQKRLYLLKGRTPKQKIDKNIGGQVWSFLKSRKAGRRWETIVGYSLDKLIDHLEARFDQNMSWENYGSYWHVDHIKPVSLFKYEKYTDELVKECWALSNLQPLEKIANIRKGNKYELPTL